MLMLKCSGSRFTTEQLHADPSLVGISIGVEQVVDADDVAHGLFRVEIVVSAALREQLLMRALLDDTSAIDHQNPVRRANR